MGHEIQGRTDNRQQRDYRTGTRNKEMKERERIFKNNERKKIEKRQLFFFLFYRENCNWQISND